MLLIASSVIHLKIDQQLVCYASSTKMVLYSTVSGTDNVSLNLWFHATHMYIHVTTITEEFFARYLIRKLVLRKLRSLFVQD